MQHRRALFFARPDARAPDDTIAIGAPSDLPARSGHGHFRTPIGENAERVQRQGATRAAPWTCSTPSGSQSLGYRAGQIFQITPVPGIWTSGPSAGLTNFVAGSDWPKSRTAP